MEREKTPHLAMAALFIGFAVCSFAAIVTGGRPLLAISGALLTVSGVLTVSNWRGATDRFGHWRQKRMPSGLPEPQFTRVMAYGAIVIGCVWIVYGIAHLAG